MALTMKLKHVDNLANGVKRFRRRLPKDVAEATGKTHLQVHFKSREGAALVREHTELMADFERLVTEVRDRLNGRDDRSPAEKWRENLLGADEVFAESYGLDRDDPSDREIVASSLKTIKADPMLIKAVLAPDAEPPKPTLKDAVEMYRRQRIKDRVTGVKLDRVEKRLAKALGPLDKIALEDLRREHGRKVSKLYTSLKITSGPRKGQPLGASSLEREVKTIMAVVNLGLFENDLKGIVANPFSLSDLPKRTGRRYADRAVISDRLHAAVRETLMGRTDRPELALAWRLMAGTGAHVSEVALLEVGDIDLDREVMEVRPNGLRGRLKTDSRDRPIPLVGDALEAAKEALSGPLRDMSSPLLPGYCKSERHPHAASPSSLGGSLNKIVESVAEEIAEERATTYGLRHRVAAKLRMAGASESIINRVQGRAISDIGASTYGGTEDRLQVDRGWMLKAGL